MVQRINAMASQSSASPSTAVRFPEFEGALNFRDLGGYRTADGRTIRWNRLYRSGTTHRMTSGDLLEVAARGIRYAFDLRSNSERKRHPNLLRGIAAMDYRFRDHERLPGDLLGLMQLLRQAGARPEGSRAVMLSLYRGLPYEFRDAYRDLFNHLAEGHLPLVFNCSAGKDRTGVAAALVLTALGVPREVIAADYLLTERFFDPCCELMLQDGGYTYFAGVERVLWEPIMRADRAYLDAMFDQLTAAHGSADAYLADELQIDAAMLDRIRSHLLERAQIPATSAVIEEN
jgi:protein-tyrosine phosphatase